MAMPNFKTAAVPNAFSKYFPLKVLSAFISCAKNYLGGLRPPRPPHARVYIRSGLEKIFGPSARKFFLAKFFSCCADPAAPISAPKSAPKSGPNRHRNRCRNRRRNRRRNWRRFRRRNRRRFGAEINAEFGVLKSTRFWGFEKY